MPSRPRGPLMRVAITLAVTAGVLATQLVQPLMAGAQALPPNRSGPARVAAGPAATARPTPRPHTTVNSAALRAQALAQVSAAEKIARYRISPAVLTFLNKDLGLRLGSSTEFTGARSGHLLRISLPAPAGLRLGLPAGIHGPSFSRSTLIIDPATGAATLTSSAAGAALRVTIADAATGAGLTGDLSVRVPVLGQTIPLSGQIGATGTVSLSGRLPASATLEAGTAGFEAGSTVMLGTDEGLRVDGPAVLGRSGHRLTVTMAGALSGRDWTFTVSRAASTAPLPGLILSPAASGTVIDDRGAVSYDVHASTARPWTLLPGAAVSGTVEFSNNLHNGSVVPAPGIAGKIPWIDVDGVLRLASGRDTVTTHGMAAVNLATGKGLLYGSVTAHVDLGAAPYTLVLDQAGFRGALRVDGGIVTGSVRGTGRVTLGGHGKPVLADAALTLTPAGNLVASFPVDRSALGLGTPGHQDTANWASGRLSATAPRGTTPSRPGVPVTGTTARMEKEDISSSYTLSGATYDFITNALNIPLGSATLTGTLSGSTLTVTASAPAKLPSSLPSWLPNPSYVSTQITVDESADTLTLTAATGTSSGLTATLAVTIDDASTSSPGISGSLALTGVPFTGGSTASLTFGLGYTGGALTASLSGSLTSGATFANGLVTIPAGAAITLATGSGLTVSGTADLNYGSGSAAINITGTLTDLSDWSLTVSDAYAPPWQASYGVLITPDFTGTISDTAGSLGFDLATAPGAVSTWTSPDGASTVAVTGLELSNLSPPSGAHCTTTQVSNGDLWAGVSGSFTYAPAATSVNVQVDATGCLDLTAESATITTDAAGDLTSQFGSSNLLPFSVTAAGITASLTDTGMYTVTGTATVVATVSGDSHTIANVGLSLGSDGIVGGVQVSLSSLGLPGNADGFLYVSTSSISDFDPLTFGFSGQPFNLPQGLVVGFDGELPGPLVTAVQKIIPAFPGNATGQAMASLSTAGFTMSLTLGLGATTNGVQVFDDNGVAFYLDSLSLSFAITTDFTNTVITMSGTGYMELPALDPGTTSPSQATVMFSGSVDATETPSLSVALGFSNWGSTGVLGVQGLAAENFGGSFGLTIDGDVPVPTLGLFANGIQLPAPWASTIGLVQGSQISFDMNTSSSQPVFSFSIEGAPGQHALTPLAIDPSLPAAEIDSFTVDQAGFDFAPEGGIDPVTQDPIQAGVSLAFDATIDGVPLNVAASVSLSSSLVYANISVGAFAIGSAQVASTAFYLDLSPANPDFGFTGGINYGNNSYSVNVQLRFGSTMNDASISLNANGQLFSYASGYLTLNGLISGDGSGASVSASGSGELVVGGCTLGPESFSLSMPNGALTWNSSPDPISQLAQCFLNVNTGPGQLVQILQGLGYDTYQIINTVGNLGSYGSTWLSDLASAFGFSSTYYDIWNDTSSGTLLVLDVEGASQAPSTPVITYGYDLQGTGYNQDWAFVQSTQPGWWDIINRDSGQCLTVQYNTPTPGNPLIQYPCNGGNNQLWYMGSGPQLAHDYVITSRLAPSNPQEVIDIADADPSAGGTLDLWPNNNDSDDWNQTFYLTSSTS